MNINAFRALAEIIAVIVACNVGLVFAALVLGTPYTSPYGTLLGVALAIVFIKSRQEDLSDFGFRKATIKASLSTAVAIMALAIVLFLFVEPVLEARFGPIDVSAFAALEGNLPLTLTLFGAAMVGAAFGEEVVYRGFIMTRLAQILPSSKVGVILAIGLQALIFALAHGYQGTTGMIEIGIVGVALGIAYYAGGRSLIPVVLAHATLDTFGIFDIYHGNTWSTAIKDLVLGAGL